MHVQTIRIHTAAVYALESMTGKILSAGSDGMINITDPSAFQSHLFAEAGEAVYCIKFLHKLKQVIAGTGSGRLLFINAEDGKIENIISDHASQVFTIEYSEEYSLLIAGSSEGSLTIYNENFHCVYESSLDHGKIRSIAVRNSECAVGCGDGTILIFILPEMKIKMAINEHNAGFSVNKVCYSPSGMLYSGSRDAHLNIYRPGDYKISERIAAHNYAIYDIQFHPPGLFATASRDKTIKLWSEETSSVLQRLDLQDDGHLNSVNKLLWVENTLVSTGDDRTIKLWNVQSLIKNK